MKRTIKNLLTILKGEVIALRRAQTEYEKSGNIELAERRKFQRWELENVIEMLKDSNKFDTYYEIYGHYLNLEKDAE